MTQDSPFGRYADCVPSIDTQRLRRMGLFDRSPNTAIVACRALSPDAPEEPVAVSWNAALGEVRISIPSDLAAPSQTVAVGRRDRVQISYYFTCPIGGDRCEKLYYSDGSWGGRTAKRLRYSSQNGSLLQRYTYTMMRLTAALEGAGGRPLPRGERRIGLEIRIARTRQKIASMPRRSQGGTPPEPRDYADLAASQDKARKVDDLTALIGRSSATDKALERAKALNGDWDDAIQWLFRRGEALKAAAGQPPRQTEPQGLKPDFIENHPRIGLRSLQERGLLKPGTRRGVQLDWTGLGYEIDRCNLLLDLREPGEWFAGIEIVSQGQVVEQSVKLAAIPDGAAFVCPLTGVEVDTIAYRNGGFASARPLRMTRRAGRG